MLNLTLVHYGSLLLSVAFAIVLLAIRIAIAQTLFYAFLLWNLALALVPFIITEMVVLYGIKRVPSFIRLFIFLIWLLFLPNSYYLITDLIHLHSAYSDWKWLDLFLVW